MIKLPGLPENTGVEENVTDMYTLLLISASLSISLIIELQYLWSQRIMLLNVFSSPFYYELRVDNM